MAVQIAIDIIDGDGARKTRTGSELDRIATVYGLTGTGNQRTMAAIEWLEGGSLLAEGAIEINTPHPYKTTARLTDFAPVAITADAVKIRLVYKEFPFAANVIRVGAVTSQVITNFGNFVYQQAAGSHEAGYVEGATTDMSVTYTFPANYQGVNKQQYAGKTFTTGLEASKFAPERTISITRQIDTAGLVGITGGQVVNDLARIYVGKTNETDWDVTPGDAPRTWICMGIEGISNDNGLTYIVTYTFQYRADKWDVMVIYLDPNTSRPPSDLVTDTGKCKYAVQSTVDFNALGLTI